MATRVTICFYYKLTDKYHKPAELENSEWLKVADCIMNEFRKFDLTSIKFPGLGYGTVLSYDHILEDELAIIVSMEFENATYIIDGRNINSYINDYLPELFDILYLARSNNSIEPTPHSKNYYVKVQFTDTYIISKIDN